MKETGIVIAGFGGQGILFLGKTIAHAAMVSGREVTWFPSYGAEMRGGTANCTVVVSEELVGSPVVSEIDILIVFNEASLKKFLPRLKQKGIFFYDSSTITVLPPEIEDKLSSASKVFNVPATEIAASDGNPRGANMVMLGAFISAMNLLEPEAVYRTIEETVPSSRKKLIDINKRLINKGIEYIENKKVHNS